MQITSPAQTYFVNRGLTEQHFCVAVDYTEHIEVASGATIRLTTKSSDGREIVNVDSRKPEHDGRVGGSGPIVRCRGDDRSHFGRTGLLCHLARRKQVGVSMLP